MKGQSPVLGLPRFTRPKLSHAQKLPLRLCANYIPLQENPDASWLRSFKWLKLREFDCVNEPISA
jgi:hypothetical protein